MRRLLAVSSLAALVTLLTALPSTEAATIAHRPIIRVGANQSTNWSGYNQGTIERGGTLFHQVAATWTVPTARQHKAGQAESSATWVGIGGGCVDAGCAVGDASLIQAGTGQDVAKNGRTSYYAWWELVPAPSLTIANFPVRPGDRVHVDIHEVVANSNVWSIAVQNLTTGRGWRTTAPYTSTHLTAEWIEETPIVVDSSGTGGIATLPTLSTVTFDGATVNNGLARLKSTEAIQLVSSSNTVEETPSTPDSDADGFNDCSYTTACSPPAS